MDELEPEGNHAWPHIANYGAPASTSFGVRVPEVKNNESAPEEQPYSW